MKILHVVPTYLPATRYGGPVYSVHGLCRALAAAGHDVHVYTTNVDGDRDSDVPVAEPVLLEGVKVWYFRSTHVRRLYWSPAMWRQLRASVASFDIVHLHSVFLWPTWAAAALAYRHRVPYVLSPRGMLVKDLVRRKSRWLKTAWIRLIEARTIRRAALLHFTASIERQEFEKFGLPAPLCCLVPNGVDSPGDDDGGVLSGDIRVAMAGEPYLLFLGRLNWKKGIDRLVNTMSSLPGQRLLIVGNDEEAYEHTIRDLVRNAGVEGRVLLLPRLVGGADKRALYAGARLFILPSYSENFGNTVVEAMAAGCPVVVTPEVGAADLVEAAKCGAVLPADNLAAGIRLLLGDTDRLAAMGLAGRDWVEQNLSWSSIAASMLEQYARMRSTACPAKGSAG